MEKKKRKSNEIVIAFLYWSGEIAFHKTHIENYSAESGMMIVHVYAGDVNDNKATQTSNATTNNTMN